MSAPQKAATLQPSLIMALHKRYEATVAEYTAIDRAEWAAREAGKSREVTGLDKARRASCEETDALRTAILHQVPDDWTDAMVLQFQITNAFDMMVNCEGQPEHEERALHTAIDTLLDFMCCTVDADHERVGGAFQAGALRVFLDRRNRTGEVEA